MAHEARARWWSLLIVEHMVVETVYAVALYDWPVRSRVAFTYPVPVSPDRCLVRVSLCAPFIAVQGNELLPAVGQKERQFSEPSGVITKIGICLSVPVARDDAILLIRRDCRQDLHI